jgi:hypothetical protein
VLAEEMLSDVSASDGTGRNREQRTAGVTDVFVERVVPAQAALDRGEL